MPSGTHVTMTETMAFETRDLHGMALARCAGCHAYRRGSDYLADEKLCRYCDGGRYDEVLSAAASADEACRPAADLPFVADPALVDDYDYCDEEVAD